MANIRDVAKEAGTSIATVSRVLSMDPTFETTAATRQNVLDAAQKLNYTKTRVRKAPKKLLLGCVLPFTVEKYSDPFFTSILSAAEEECIAHNALICMVRNHLELENPAVLDELCSYGLTGLILMEQLPEPMLRRLRESIRHIITVDVPGSEFNSVGFDNYTSNLDVMRCLLARGYRRIAYLGGSSPSMDFHNAPRMAAYREALFQAGLAFDASLTVNCGWDLDACAEAAERLLRGEDRPDAIFAGSDTLASVILGVIQRLGLRCPEDVGVIGFNNIAMSALMTPPLSTVDIPTREIGVVVVRRLLELIGAKAGDPVFKITFPTTLVLRDSLRPAEQTD